MKNQLFSILLLSSFCIISANSAEKSAQTANPVITPEQQRNHEMIDRYTKCSALLTLQDFFNHPDTVFAGTEEQREKHRALLEKQINEHQCSGEEFEHLLKFLQAVNATKDASMKLEKYNKDLLNKIGISEAEFAQKSAFGYQETLQELNK